MTTKTANPFGLDFSPSNVGREADALNVAWTAGILHARIAAGPLTIGQTARHAVALHVISGSSTGSPNGSVTRI